MNETIPFGDLIVLGAVALFIILRYRSILGQKTGHDFTQKPVQTKEVPVADSLRDAEGAVLSLPMKKEPAVKEGEAGLSPVVVSGISKIKSQDPQFTIAAFLSGARAAFEMAIDAANKKDKETLHLLLSKEVCEMFEADFAKQEKEGHTRHTTLVALKSSEIMEAEVKRTTASITVQFSSEQITILRDKDGAIIEGNPSDVDDVVDEWVLERDLKSRNPNWTIVAT